MQGRRSRSQELDALFVDTGGATIFPLTALLIDGEPHPDDFAVPGDRAGDRLQLRQGRPRPRRLRRR